MFKVGDKVMCIDDEQSGGAIKKGKIYKVLYVSSYDTIELKPGGILWIISRFKRVKDNMSEIDFLDSIQRNMKEG